jgi:hypothetical protein
MRGVRSLIILLVIAIPLGWFAWRDSQRPADDGPARDKVFDVEADRIEEIAIRPESGEQTTLRKSGSDWQIVEPSTAPSDASEVSGLTRNLATLEIQRVVDENPPDLKEYGLDTPRVEVAFKAGGQEHRLLLGDKTPPGSDLYAKRASDPAVFLVASYLESTFNRRPFDLRDKSVLKVERDTLDTVEVASAGRTLRFAKPSGEWQMVAPVQARADYGAVEGLVGRIAGLQMRAIVDENPANLRTFGLEKPAASVSVGAGSSQATLAIGGTAGDGAVYARDAARPVVFTIDASVLEEAKKGPAEFRQKDLFDARSFNATHLEVVRGGQTHAFERTTTTNEQGQEQQAWRQTAPGQRDIDQAAFDKLLSAVTALRATTFTDAAPKALGTPELTATVRSEEGKKEERVTLARAADGAYASRTGEPGAARIENDGLDAVVTALQELK